MCTLQVFEQVTQLAEKVVGNDIHVCEEEVGILPGCVQVGIVAGNFEGASGF